MGDWCPRDEARDAIGEIQTNVSGVETDSSGSVGVMGEDGGGWTLGEEGDVAVRFKVGLEDVISMAGVEGSIGAPEARGDLQREVL